MPQWHFPEGEGLPARQLVEGTLAPIVLLDARPRHLYVNAAWVEASGLPASAFLGRTLGEVLPDLQRPDDVLFEVLADGRRRDARRPPARRNRVTRTVRAPLSTTRPSPRPITHPPGSTGRRRARRPVAESWRSRRRRGTVHSAATAPFLPEKRVHCPVITSSLR
ncbi:PAS domain-containing protein [Streptomyces griseoloalbus]|uniref:PAS domain-containing protein n=1 Tax=Streptomyces griseoloalbus TaxID=67303 RepID=UPI003F68C807